MIETEEGRLEAARMMMMDATTTSSVRVTPACWRKILRPPVIRHRKP